MFLFILSTICLLEQTLAHGHRIIDLKSGFSWRKRENFDLEELQAKIMRRKLQAFVILFAWFFRGNFFSWLLPKYEDWSFKKQYKDSIIRVPGIDEKSELKSESVFEKVTESDRICLNQSEIGLVESVQIDPI